MSVVGQVVEDGMKEFGESGFAAGGGAGEADDDGFAMGIGHLPRIG